MRLTCCRSNLGRRSDWGFNRDSRPFISQYHFGDDWNIQQFVRGTLRYAGWQEAWQPIFDRIEQGIADRNWQMQSDELWQSMHWQKANMTVLCLPYRFVSKMGKFVKVWHRVTCWMPLATSPVLPWLDWFRYRLASLWNAS